MYATHFEPLMHNIVYLQANTGNMKIINSREFRDHQKMYFDLADNDEQIIIRRTKNRSYKLVPVSYDDLLMEIPEEFRCDPYLTSPSGDVYWADTRNIDKVKKAAAVPIVAIINSEDSVAEFLNKL